MTQSLTATCHCGAVHLELQSEPVGVLACHCSDCQKMHGNFNAFLAVPAGDVYVAGGDALVWYQILCREPPSLLRHMRGSPAQGDHTGRPLADLGRPD